MIIFRAVFWLIAVAILLPQETSLGRSEFADLLGHAPLVGESGSAAAEAAANPEIFDGFRDLALQSLQRLKEERAAQRSLEATLQQENQPNSG